MADDDDQGLVLALPLRLYAHDVADFERHGQRDRAAQAFRLRLRAAQLRCQTLEYARALPSQRLVPVLAPAIDVAAAVDDRERAVAHVWEQASGLHLRRRERHPEQPLGIGLLEIVVEGLKQAPRRVLRAQPVEDRLTPLVPDIRGGVVGEDGGPPRTQGRGS